MDECGYSASVVIEKNISSIKMEDFEGFNLRLQRKELIQNPEIEEIQTRAGVRYVMRGFGSDGTKISKFISRTKYDELLNRERQIQAGRAQGVGF